MATNFSTIGGTVTKAETLAKLLDHLREAQDCCYVIGHLHQTEDTDHDRLLAKGWRSFGHMVDMVHKQVLELAKGKLQ